MSIATTFPCVSSEAEHFDALIRRNGESWWGHTTAAGLRRLQRRAGVVRRLLPTGPAYAVLEIAAGAGALTEALLRQEPTAQVVATDVSPVSVLHLSERLRRYPNVRAEVADATRLPYEDGTFDAVVGNSALHHVDVARCFSELFRVLRPGGRLVVFEPNLLNPQVALEMNVLRGFAQARLEYSPGEQTYTRWTYKRLLRQAGFEEPGVRPFDFLHPLTPRWGVAAVEFMGKCAERIPGLREITGSLLLTARRPTDTDPMGRTRRSW